MARILVPHHSDWYEQLSVIASYYETEYEDKFLGQIEEAFPDFYAIYYKKKVVAIGYDSKKPDLALVKKDFSEWWLVEVELEAHDLKEVVGQVEVFLLAKLNPYSDGKYIHKAITKRYKGVSISETDVRAMISNYAQNVLVVVDEYIEEWEKTLGKLGAHLCVFQVFKSTNGPEAFRLAGIYPTTNYSESHCNCGDKDPRVIQVSDPSSINIHDGEEIDLVYAEKTARYKVYLESGKTMLLAIGKMNHIPTSSLYCIYRDSHKRLLIKAI